MGGTKIESCATFVLGLQRLQLFDRGTDLIGDGFLGLQGADSYLLHLGLPIKPNWSVRLERAVSDDPHLTQRILQPAIDYEKIDIAGRRGSCTSTCASWSRSNASTDGSQ